MDSTGAAAAAEPRQMFQQHVEKLWQLFDIRPLKNLREPTTSVIPETKPLPSMHKKVPDFQVDAHSHNRSE